MTFGVADATDSPVFLAFIHKDELTLPTALKLHKLEAISTINETTYLRGTGVFYLGQLKVVIGLFDCVLC